MNILIHFIFLTTFLDTTYSLFKGNIMKKLKSKAKDYYKSKFGTKGLNFMGYELSEYPGSNKLYRDENIAKWDEYYQCLEMQNLTLGVHRSFVPEAVLAYEGGFVKFDCKLCISPESQHDLEAVEWDFGKPDDNFLTLIELTEHIIIAPEDKSLSMYNIQEGHTGQYVCRLGQTITAPTYLTVIKGDNLTEVHSKNAEKGPYPQKMQSISGSKALYLDTVWGIWSQCNRCGKVGKRHRHGYCVIKHSATIAQKIQEIEQTSMSTVPDLKTNATNATDLLDLEDELMRTTTSQATSCLHCKEIELNLLQIFEGGMPCSSHILPESFQEIPELMARRGEIMVGYCKMQCPKAELFEVRDKHGKVLEVANNSAGIYSMLQPIPPPVPPLVQQVQYAIKGKTVMISCPGNLNTDTPIIWQISGKNVIPELLKEESLGRIYISLSDKIYIKHAKLSDSNTYSCWQNNEVAGMVRLVVEKKLEMNFNHHIMLFGMIIILSTFAFVYVKAFFGRKYAKT